MVLRRRFGRVSGALALCVAWVVVLASSVGAEARAQSVLWIGDAREFGTQPGEPAGVSFADWVDEFLRLDGPNRPDGAEPQSFVTDDAATFADANARFARYVDLAPPVIVLSFGRADAADGPAEAFRSEYGELLDRFAKELPNAELLLATSFPSGQANDPPRSAALESRAVEPVRALAAERELRLVDRFLLLRSLAETDGGAEVFSDAGQLTQRARIVSGRFSAWWIRRALEERAKARAVANGDQAAAGDTVDGPAPEPFAAFAARFRTQVEPKLRIQLASEDSRERAEALKGLLDVLRPDEPMLDALVDLAIDGDRDSAQFASGTILSLSSYHHPRVVSRLVAEMREHRVASASGEKAVELLANLLGNRGGGRRSSRTSRRIEPSPADRRSLLDGVLEPSDLELLKDGLSVRSERVWRACAVILFGAGPEGLERIRDAARSASSSVAVELCRYLFESGLRADPSEVERDLLSLLDVDERPDVREILLRVLVAQSGVKSLDRALLEEALRDSDRSLQSSALAECIDRGREGLDLISSWASNGSRDDRKLAFDAYLDVVVRAESDDVARDALRLADESLRDGFADRLISFVPGAMSHSSGSRTRTTRPVQSRTRRSPTRSSSPRQGLSRPVRAERLVLFLPALEQLAASDDEELRTGAESALRQLARVAVEREGVPPATGDSEPSTDDSGPVPGEAPSDLAKRIRKRAKEAYELHDWPEYVEGMRRAVAADPSNYRYVEYLAWFLATVDDDALADPVEAEALAERALAEDGREVQHLESLAASLARQGRFDAAVDVQFEALEHASSDDKTNALERLVKYLSDRPHIVPPGS